MTQTGVYWLAPASASGALLAGLLFMIGHHLFYQNLHGTPVSDNTLFDFDISQQQINIAVGTAFAFLAKACMVLAISTSFVQMFWRAISAQSREAAPTLERVDAVHSTLDNAFEMFNLRSWYAHPLLMLVAGLAWYVNRPRILCAFAGVTGLGLSQLRLSLRLQHFQCARRKSLLFQSLLLKYRTWISPIQTTLPRCRTRSCQA